MTGPEIDALSPPAVDRRAERLMEREISVLMRPDVALHQTKDGTARRHLMRSALRIVSLATGDVIAATVAAFAVRAVVEWLSTMLGRGYVPYSSTAEFAGAVILAL